MLRGSLSDKIKKLKLTFPSLFFDTLSGFFLVGLPVCLPPVFLDFVLPSPPSSPFFLLFSDIYAFRCVQSMRFVRVGSRKKNEAFLLVFGFKTPGVFACTQGCMRFRSAPWGPARPVQSDRSVRFSSYNVPMGRQLRSK